MTVTNVCCASVDENGKLLSYNHNFIRFFGYESCPALIGKNLKEILQKKKAEEILRAIELCKLNTNQTITIEVKSRAPEAEECFQWTIYQNQNSEGKRDIHLIGKNVCMQKKEEENILYQAKLLSTIKDAIVSTDKKFIIKTWNKAAETLFELKAEEVIGRPIWKVVQYEILNVNKNLVIRTLIEKQHWQGNIKHYRTDGSQLFAEASFTPVFNTKDEKIGYVAVIRDKTNDLYLRSKLRNFYNISTIIEEGFFILNKDFRIEFGNEEAIKIGKEVYGFEGKLNDNILEKVPSYRKAPLSNILGRVLNGESIRYEIEVPRNNKSSKWLDCNYIPARDIDNNITGIYANIKDITVKKELEKSEQQKIEFEKELSRSKMLFDLFMDHTPHLAWINDSKGTLKYMNQAHSRLLNLKKEDIGKSLMEILPQELAQESYKINLQVIRDAKPQVNIQKKLNLDGSSSIYKVHRFPFYFNEETYIGGWAVDVTQEENLQKKLIEQEKRNKRQIIKSALEVQEKERQELSAELHDNVNQILTSCKLLLEASLLKKDMTDQLIRKCNHSLQQAITEIRRISHSLNPSAINDIGLIAAINEMLERINITGKVHFTFEYKLSQCIDMLKHEDQVAIYRTIQESVCNIIKHSKAKNAIIRICYNATGVLLIIKDDGIGLDTEKVKKGLGLKTINNRVQYYNGKLKLVSSPGGGCTMKIFFNMHVHVNKGSYVIFPPSELY